MLFDSQMREEPVDIAFGKSAGLPVLVELDRPANLMHVGFFSASAVMANPEDSEQMIVEPGHGLS
ncbi:MAG: hypothetical protein ACQESR_04450 [Planctomycetota bacterium]